MKRFLCYYRGDLVHLTDDEGEALLWLRENRTPARAAVRDCQRQEEIRLLITSRRPIEREG